MNHNLRDIAGISSDTISFQFKPFAGALPRTAEFAVSHNLTFPEPSPDGAIQQLERTSAIMAGIGTYGEKLTDNALRRTLILGRRGIGQATGDPSEMGGVLFAAGFEYWKTEPTAFGVQSMAYEGINGLNEYLQAQGHKAHHLGVNSQANLGLDAAIKAHPDVLNELGTDVLSLWSPMGLTPGMSTPQFLGRMARTASQPDFLMGGLSAHKTGNNSSFRLGQDLLRTGRLESDPSVRRRGAQILYATTYDGVPVLRGAIERRAEDKHNLDVRLFIPENDRVIPRGEIDQAFREGNLSGVMVVDMDGSHAIPASRRGGKQASTILNEYWDDYPHAA